MSKPVIARVPNATAIAKAAAWLRRGRLIAFPTETVYGLGADAGNDAAVAAIFAAKERPRFNPLIAHVENLAAAERLAEFEPRARKLAEALWPGPLTLVLPRRADAPLSLLVSAGLDSVAVRIPSHPIARALLGACRVPVAAPSANRFGSVSPTTAAHVVDDLGDRVDLIIDGGRCRVGIESTIVELCGATPRLLRPGGIPAEVIEELIGPLAAPDDGPPRAPGMLSRHYAPRLPLRTDAAAARAGEALLGFGVAGAAADLNLSRSGDLVEAAANLFAMLHTLDRGEFTGIAVMPIPQTGLGRAINDRLRRAALATAGGGGGNEWTDRGPAAPCVLPGMDDEA